MVSLGKLRGIAIGMQIRHGDALRILPTSNW